MADPPDQVRRPHEDEPDTPSSTVVEFGDLSKENVLSAAQIFANVHDSFAQSWLESRPQLDSQNPATDAHDTEGCERWDQSSGGGVAMERSRDNADPPRSNRSGSDVGKDSKEPRSIRAIK